MVMENFLKYLKCNKFLNIIFSVIIIKTITMTMKIQKTRPKDLINLKGDKKVPILIKKSIKKNK